MWDLSWSIQTHHLHKDGVTNAFNLPSPSFKPLCLVRESASVNCWQWHQYCPHANGTHTETLGHITPTGRPSIQDLLDVDSIPILQPCLVLHVHATRQSDVVESKKEEQFVQEKEKQDLLKNVEFKNIEREDHIVELQSVQSKVHRFLQDTTDSSPKAIVLMVHWPGMSPLNTEQGKDYSNTNPAYIHPEVMLYLRHHFHHVLVNLPSVDKEQDGGQLASHRAFFLPQDSDSNMGRTITELCRSVDMAEGWYQLNLQLLRSDMDASPSRPVLMLGLNKGYV